MAQELFIMVKGVKIQSAITMKLKAFFKCISLAVLLLLVGNMLYVWSQRDSGSSYQKIYCNVNYYYFFLLSIFFENRKRKKSTEISSLVLILL
jgi:hypothetical protein